MFIKDLLSTFFADRSKSSWAATERYLPFAGIEKAREKHFVWLNLEKHIHAFLIIDD